MKLPDRGSKLTDVRGSAPQLKDFLFKLRTIEINSGKCALCCHRLAIDNSHIIPKFVFRWLKKTGATDYLRTGLEPNKKQQDGLKRSLLCKDCESMLSDWEGATHQGIFPPLHQTPQRVASYGDWFLKFCVSVSWRVLTVYKHVGLPDLTETQMRATDRALTVWGSFLREERPHPEEFEQHVLPMDNLEHYESCELPPNFNRYVMRSVDIDVASGSRNVIVYSKMCGLVLIGFIDVEKPRKWQGTKVHVKRGTVGPKEYRVPDWLLEYMSYKATRVSSSMGNLSSRQNAKFQDFLDRNPDKVAKSESFRSLKRDVELFGSKVFEPSKLNDE